MSRGKFADLSRGAGGAGDGGRPGEAREGRNFAVKPRSSFLGHRAEGRTLTAQGPIFYQWQN